MYGANLHPYDELIIQERLHPKRRYTIKPIVTEPLTFRTTRNSRFHSIPALFTLRSGRGLMAECCPTPCA